MKLMPAHLNLANAKARGDDPAGVSHSFSRGARSCSGLLAMRRGGGCVSPRVTRAVPQVVVKGYARVFGPRHGRTLRALINVALVVKASGDLQLARALHSLSTRPK